MIHDSGMFKARWGCEQLIYREVSWPWHGMEINDFVPSNPNHSIILCEELGKTNADYETKPFPLKQVKGLYIKWKICSS